MICLKHLLLRTVTKAIVLVFVPGDLVVVRYQNCPRGYRLLSHGDSTVDQKEDWKASSRVKTSSNMDKTTTLGPPTSSRL